MKITKEQFAYILEVLEQDYIIGGYYILKNQNAISVDSTENTTESATYYFNDNNVLINPQVFEIQKQIKDLQEKIKKLQKVEKNLLTLNK